MEQQILAFLGKILAYGGGAAAVAYAVFLSVGKKWIESQFQDRLEQSRHENAKELEHLKFEITSLLNRVTTLHQKEFEVIPEAWSRFHEVLFRLRPFVSFFQQFPDLDHMSQDRLLEFLDQSKLLDSEKNELRSASKKTDLYQKLIFWHVYSDVRNAFSDFHNYLEKNQIFMSKDLCEQFSKIDGILWEVLIKREVGHQYVDHKMWVEASQQMRNEIEPLRKEIECLVQNRLKSEKTGI
ncbi:MAG: hypothetical protein PHD01_01410 [Geobacteraceae bacterium]|nr:hypothetical protein [Geobacteraceae bacterium]